MKLIRAKLACVVTRGRTFIPEVDGLRFVAITAVVFYHLRAFTPGHIVTMREMHPLDSLLSMLLDVGHYGVQLFLVLSCVDPSWPSRVMKRFSNLRTSW
jgi:peptidoglycan/LPS O-acetylase OafA/YrhL